MKRNLIVILSSIVLIIALIVTPVLAKENQNNGTPFQELWDAIEQLSNEIPSMVEQAVNDALLNLSIEWEQITGVPGDIADGDDVGITEESDPTVPDSLKDGVSWEEISDIPEGFADGIDNEGEEGSGNVGYYSIHASEFHPQEGSYEYQIVRGDLTTFSPLWPIWYTALHLPDGVEIKEIAMWVNNSSGHSEFYLRRVEHTEIFLYYVDWPSTVIAENTNYLATNYANFQKYTTDISEPIIDNENYTYLLEVSLGTGGYNGAALRSVRITYETP